VRRQAAASAWAETTDVEQEEFVGEDFYTILGVSPRADVKEIKLAYYSIMKDCHPDLSGDEESTEFCMLLNEIYETLTDPERRTLYDSMVGFAENSINPFVDTSFPADQVFVDEFTCIGCRNCCNVCPKTFDIEDDWGRARVMKQGVDVQDKLQEAIDTCPVSCIHWVTSPQLSLLEASMARMERVAVWSLMSGGGGGRDVFTEASMSWEKRQVQVRARLQQQKDSARMQQYGEAGWGGWWGSTVGAAAGANMYAQAARASRSASSSSRSSPSGSWDGGDSSSYDSFDEGQEGSGLGKEGQRIAALAAKAARASRAWKSMQELQQQQKARILLPASASASLND